MFICKRRVNVHRTTNHVSDCQINKYMKAGAFCNLQAEIFEFCIKSSNFKLLTRVILKRSDRVETPFLESSNFSRNSKGTEHEPEVALEVFLISFEPSRTRNSPSQIQTNFVSRGKNELSVNWNF